MGIPVGRRHLRPVDAARAVDGVTGTATAIATGRSHTLAVLVPEPAGSWLGAVACTALLAIARRRNPAHGEQR